MKPSFHKHRDFRREKKKCFYQQERAFYLKSGGISKSEAEVVLSAKIYDSHHRVAPSQYDGWIELIDV